MNTTIINRENPIGCKRRNINALKAAPVGTFRAKSGNRSRFNVLMMLISILIMASCGRRTQTAPKNNPGGRNSHIPASTVDTLSIADPTIFNYQGAYYLYGTSAGKSVNAGFKGFVSNDLSHWTPVFKKARVDRKDNLVLDSLHSYGHKGFWAPQVFSLNNYNKNKMDSKHLIIAYTANEQIAIAYGRSSRGPFSQKRPFAPLFNDSYKHIDPFVFVDFVSGKTFMYYVKLDKGNKIFVCELKRSFVDGHAVISGVKAGTERLCIQATAPWENTAKSSWPVTEGPTVLYHNGFYYLLYSANDFRNPDYAVGYATATSPMGPWIKQSSSPVINGKRTGLAGTGHGDVFKSTEGQYYYVFHAHHTQQQVSPRKTYLISFSFKPDTGKGGDKIQGNPDLIQMNYSSVRPLLLSDHK